eukprot:scaffold15150_cov32-Tisochrysis_lutea.AAC.6
MTRSARAGIPSIAAFSTEACTECAMPIPLSGCWFASNSARLARSNASWATRRARLSTAQRDSDSLSGAPAMAFQRASAAR